MSCDAYGKLTDEQRTYVRFVSDLAMRYRGRCTLTWPDGCEAYAYPHPGGGIAWGVNGGTRGFCVARGICRSES